MKYEKLCSCGRYRINDETIVHVDSVNGVDHQHINVEIFETSVLIEANGDNVWLTADQARLLAMQLNNKADQLSFGWTE